MKKFLLLFLLPIFCQAQQIKVMYVDSSGMNRIASFNLPQVAISGYSSNLTAKPLTLLNAPILKGALTPINVTATVTAAQLAAGCITTTSTAAVTLTLPTATLMATQFGASQGYYFDFVIDNTASTSLGVVTLTLGTGTTALAVITGGNTLTTAIGKVGVFRIYFSSATVAWIVRLG